MSAFTSRRMAFQLTPLLDLLLIVIFAQYLDVKRETEEHQEATSKQLATAKDKSQEHIGRADRLEQQLDAARKRAAKLQNDLAQARESQTRLAKAIQSLFQVPDKLVNSVVNADPNLSPKERERLKQEFKKLAEAQSSAMVKHIVASDEIRKRVDVWELRLERKADHVLTSFRTRLNDPGDPAGEFRYFRRGNTARAVQIKKFKEEVYSLYKSQPQPKSVVIILLAAPPDGIPFEAVETARIGLDRAIDDMRKQSGDRSRFYPAIVRIAEKQP